MLKKYESFETLSNKMDDNFEKSAKKMAKIAIIGYLIIFGVLGLIGVGFLYLIKIWFF